MNNRQKLVQQQFLNNETAVIKRLGQVYGVAQKDIDAKIKNLEFRIGELTEQYDWMEDDDPEKERIRSMIQSKIYQKQYQQSLQDQVGGILDQMHTKEFLTVSDYLNTCYEDGFVGSLFDMHGQGVPLMIPMDQTKMVRAVQLDSKISQGLYTRMGQDIGLLKKKITAQVSRSIATGTSYAQTAKQLAGVARIAYNNSIRIARTEGHRIQTTAAMDAMEQAKEKGADVVKQWDSTLDGATRDSHARVDGEICELDEKFSNGLMYPGDPAGGAAEVINCRCALLQRARWALDEDELQKLKKRAEFFGLDKAKQFDDYKSKYLKASTEFENIQLVFKGASSIEDAAKYAKENLGLGQTTAYLLGMNVDVANGLNEAIFRIGNTFGSLTENGYLDNILLYTKKNGSYAAYQNSLRAVYLNPAVKNKSAIKKMAADAMSQFGPGAWSTGHAFHTVYHELGHAVQHMILDNDAYKKNQIEVLYRKSFSDILGAETVWTLNPSVVSELAMKSKQANFSYYGLKDSGEFVAESIAQYFLSDNPSDIAKNVVGILRGKRYVNAN